ncbi:hypothetical protein ACTI_40670 [Actinoplanes sp. OR16]|uniref:helix-turn-helix transcriptional regulator n=1 Tax=Actinoplanes sp. OR16 TaxID=946334 RepID=UPI000F6B9FBD|nr:LuxR family transcriptional regulator [Actinoplanes sp. OR16]BBH67382.1 hypothetical protein ACTI_40670 [Actinoplanes sp. OR16]
MGLWGRAGESAALQEFVEAVRCGLGAAVVVRGEAGVGKTALLENIVFGDVRVLRVGGVEQEAHFPYAALHRLLIPLLSAMDVQHALGLDDQPPVEAGSAARAVFQLLAEAGEPVICCVDDAQWIDPESLEALARIAELLPGSPVGLIVAGRHRHIPAQEIEVGGLTGTAGIELLKAVVNVPLDEMIAARLVAATGGNPLALHDLARELTPEQWVGTRSLPDPLPVGDRLIEAFRGPHGILDTAEDHPLVRAAAYSAATGAERRAAHAAIAAATTRPEDADRRAWHRAAASVSPDPQIAAELARTADLAARRSADSSPESSTASADSSPESADGSPESADGSTGSGGHTARVTFLLRAAEMSPDAEDRERYHLAAAEAALAAGAPQQALRLVSGVAVGARALLVRANALVMTEDEGACAQGAGLCLYAARAFGPADPGAATEALLDAVEHLLRAGHLAKGTNAAEIAAAAEELNAGDDLLTAFITIVRGGRADIRRLLEKYRDGPDDVLVRRQFGVGVLGELAGDPELLRTFRQRAAEATRRTGMPRQRGVTVSEEGLEAAERLGAGYTVSLIRSAMAAAALGRGDYITARAIARDVAATDELGLHRRVLPDLVEAAVRSGDSAVAVQAGEDFVVADTPWSRGLLARTRALLAPPSDAEPLYREAIHLLAGAPARADLARAHLLYGEWLRRRRRRRDARAALTRAWEMYDAMGDEGFAGRAARELAATGDSGPGAGRDLTAQEQAIADLAATGATNTEIAARLFLSANTVDHHLRKIYRKLEVTSRRQLQPALRRDTR